MSDTNRRFECRTTYSVEMAEKAYRTNLRHDGLTHLSFAMMLFVALWSVGLIVAALVQGQGLPLFPLAILIAAAALIALQIGRIRKTLRTLPDTFRKKSPDGPYQVITWVEGSALHASSTRTGRSSLPLDSFASLVSWQDVVLLRTRKRQYVQFDRAALTDAQWNELAGVLRKANPAFRNKLKTQKDG